MNALQDIVPSPFVDVLARNRKMAGSVGYGSAASRNHDDAFGKLSKMQAQYLGIVALVGLAALIAGVLSAVSWVLGPKKNTKYKSAPYECGVAPVGDAHERFPIKFYLVAIVFILFDIEVVFLWSWMTVFKSADTQFMIYSFFEFLIYMATWIVGYLYAIKVGAIDWDETTSLAPEKLGLGNKPVPEYPMSSSEPIPIALAEVAG